jgi:hypothetical protein
MLQTAVRSLLVISLTLITTSFTLAAEAAQRRSRPSNNLPNGLDPLGLWQPESVRAILLLYSGKSVSKGKAEELEAALRKEPEKVDERLVLIGYYGANGRTPADRANLRKHVLWMVERHPEHPATSEPGLRDLPDDAEANAQILAFWRKHVEMRAADLAVLKNAEKFFFSKDPAEAERLIHRIAEKEPDNREWANELAQLYRMFGIPGRTISDPVQRALETYDRVLALIRNTTAREALAGDMADAAFKLGDFQGAAELARIHLRGKDHTATQRANTILGRIALRSGDLDRARRHLLDSSRPEAGKDVALAGPSMVLARELLEEGDDEAVLQYMDNCLSLWPRGENVLQIWMDDVRNGRMPKFGNLGL